MANYSFIAPKLTKQNLAEDVQHLFLARMYLYTVAFYLVASCIYTKWQEWSLGSVRAKCELKPCSVFTFSARRVHRRRNRGLGGGGGRPPQSKMWGGGGGNTLPPPLHSWLKTPYFVNFYILIMISLFLLRSLFLAHLSQRLKWAIAVRFRPSSVVRRPSCVVRRP